MADRSDLYVIPGGQEALVRRMVAPALPTGWRFVRASIHGAEVEARYHHAGDGVHAAMVLSRGDVDDAGETSPHLAVQLRSSRDVDGVRALRSCLLASVRAAESELAWAPASPPRPPPVDASTTRFAMPAPPRPSPDDASPWRPPDAPPHEEAAPPPVAPADSVVEFLGLRDVLGAAVAPWDDCPAAARVALRRALGAALRGRRDRALGSLARALSYAPSSLRVALVASVARFALCAYGDSVAALEGFVARDPSPAARLAASSARVTLLGRLGWYHEALEALDDAIARFPDALSLRVAASRLHDTLHDTDGAEAHLRAAFALDPASIDVPLRASQLLATSGDVAGARAWLAEVIPRADSPALLGDVAARAMSLGDYDVSESLYLRVRSLSPDDVRARVALGTLAAWRGDVAGARAHADAVLDACPDHAAGLRLRGAARALDGDVAGALEDFTAAVARDPTDAESFVWRAESLLRLGDAESALVAVQRGAELSPDGSDYVAAQLVRSLALSRLGRFPGMPDHVLRPAVDALCGSAPSPRSTVARMEHALAALRGNRSTTLTRVDESGALVRVATEVSPRVPAKHALWRFVATADVAASLRAFERVRAAYPSAAEPSNYEGEVHLYAGSYAEAGRCFTRALAQYGRSRWAFIGLTAVAVLEGRPGDALDVMVQCVEASGPPGPTAYVYRGEAYRRLGRVDEARSDLEHAVRAHPSRVGAWVNLGLLQLATGDAAAGDTVRALREVAPGFAADALAELGLDEGAWSSPASWGPLLERMLHMLRGNRGSSCVTYFTRDGRLRTAPAESPARFDAAALLARVRAVL